MKGVAEEGPNLIGYAFAGICGKRWLDFSPAGPSQPNSTLISSTMVKSKLQGQGQRANFPILQILCADTKILFSFRVKYDLVVA